MTEGEQIVALLKVICNRLARIERHVCGEPSLYTVAEDGVLTRVRSPSQITEGSTAAGVQVIPIRGPVS